MYRVLIAEDSKPILRNIQSLLTSLELPLDLAAKAANGEEALELIRQQHFDLLLTDIRMPKMDGLALIEQAKQLHPRLLAVLISGYNDFEYTRKAINLQVFDYLLKPVERKQLAEVMERAMEQLNSQGHEELESWKEIVDLREVPDTDRKGLQLYGNILLILQKQPFSKGSADWSRQAVQQHAAEFFKPHGCWVYPSWNPKQMLAVVPKAAMEGYGSLNECMNNLRKHLEQIGLPVSIAGRSQSLEPGMLKGVYHQMSDLLQARLRIKQSIAVDGDHAVLQSAADTDQESMERELLASFTEMLRGYRKEQLLLKGKEQLSRWAEEDARLAQLERFIRTLKGAFLQAGAELDADIRVRIEKEASHLLNADRYEDFCSRFEAWLKQVFEQLQSLRRKSPEELFRQLDQYIRSNLYSQLSITDIARKFHVSPSYVSRIMKRCAQSSFVQYYTRLKITEACRLMADRSDMKVKEVSDALSFSDQHYFSKVFKEYTGLSPTEYKEKHQSQG
ncbi:response regulator transcription factor [Paenibacillus apis]|uniref:Response regulator n=1 Tax=Paenibacillus apis TaxID=1792174 RepID=A0A919XVY0_9BACL|nr:response regulator [Paenibacillus apis]GIO40281.1 hypothetical protein J41TS4_00390 [Paenibacillus apis]